MGDIGKLDHRVHIMGPDGSVVKEKHYALHIVGGDRFYNIPPGSAKFYTEGGHELELDQVPEIAKKHLAKKALEGQSVADALGKVPVKKGKYGKKNSDAVDQDADAQSAQGSDSEGDADSLI